MKKENCQKAELLEHLENKLLKKYPDRIKMSKLCIKIKKVFNEDETNLPIPMQLGVLELLKFELFKEMIKVDMISDDCDNLEKIYEQQLRKD